MNTSTPSRGDDSVVTLQRVVRLLVTAEVRAVDLPGTDADQCDFALAAALLTSQALRLLPAGVTVDDVPSPAERDPRALLRAAEQLIRAHPIEDLPPGTTQLVADLCDLIGPGRAMSGRDHRSVGELLLDADHTARDVLMDAGDLDAAAMLRTWGEAVQTAEELWSALPSAPSAASPTQRPAAADTMAQVAAMTAALDRGIRRGPWPGTGPTDARLQAIADGFARAADLIHRHGPPGPSSDPAVRADADAARTRIIHTLYIASHGVRLAVIAEERRLEHAATSRGRSTVGQEPRRCTVRSCRAWTRWSRSPEPTSPAPSPPPWPVSTASSRGGHGSGRPWRRGTCRPTAGSLPTPPPVTFDWSPGLKS